MEYYVLLKIAAPNTEYFIEVGLDYEIPFHPNLTDEINIADFPCKITEIYYDLDHLNYVTMRAVATDNVISMRHNPSKEDIHKWLQNEWRQLCQWTNENEQKIILNDYFMNPEKDFDEENA